MERKKCEIKEWNEMPLLCDYTDIMGLGMGQAEARALLDREDCPTIDYGGLKKIERYALKRFLQKGVKKFEAQHKK